MTKYSSGTSLSPFARFPSADAPRRSGSYIRTRDTNFADGAVIGQSPARCYFGTHYKTQANAVDATPDFPHGEVPQNWAPLRDLLADNFRIISSKDFWALTRDMSGDIGDAGIALSTLQMNISSRRARRQVVTYDPGAGHAMGAPCFRSFSSLSDRGWRALPSCFLLDRHGRRLERHGETEELAECLGVSISATLQERPFLIRRCRSWRSCECALELIRGSAL